MCGRPKWTPDDLKRWQDEIDAWAAEDRTRAIRDFNPDWAKAICWFCGTGKCPMRPLTKEKTDV